MRSIHDCRGGLLLARLQLRLRPGRHDHGCTRPARRHLAARVRPRRAVGATGIPLGATELATPGVSTPPVGTAALGSMTASTACSGIGASAQPTTSIPGTSGMVTTSAPNAMTATGAMTLGDAGTDSLVRFHGLIGERLGHVRQRHRDGVVQCNGFGLFADRSRRAIDRRPRRDFSRLDRAFAGRPQSAA